VCLVLITASGEEFHELREAHNSILDGLTRANCLGEVLAWSQKVSLSARASASSRPRRAA
jgi:hypothetical protein